MKVVIADIERQSLHWREKLRFDRVIARESVALPFREEDISSYHRK